MYKTITIKAGSGGWGGPLTISPTEKCNKILSVTGGGVHPVAQSKQHHLQRQSQNQKLRPKKKLQKQVKVRKKISLSVLVKLLDVL